MDIINLQENFPNFGEDLVLCLGTFDGFHKGHQRLVIEASLSGEGKVGVLLFDQNPANFLSNGKEKAILTSEQDQIEILKKLRVDVALIAHVDAAFFGLSPEDFMTKYLKPLHPSLLVVGEDFRFGKGALGTPKTLAKSFPVLTVPLLEENGVKISTSAIKQSLKEGKVEEASALLGRPYEIHGKVVHGYEYGRKIGFPTANVSLKDPYLLPKGGVYEVMAYVLGIPRHGLANVGTNPTIGLLQEPIVEVYLEDFNQDIYDKTIYVDFLTYERPEIKFDSLEELQTQLQKDKDWLKSRRQ
ncbi:MAG: Riboflavin biosynthesis protein RibF [Tenericutes bacterium ADurb.BinA155]|nr:MAG: Riboflavin biosynthesis protein RibF [Tenericutes bacterium ADurb.BinA155]